MAVALALCVVTLGASLPAQAPADDPLATYKTYLAVLAKAKSVDELLPFYTKELSAGLSKMPADMKANYLKMNARTLTDLKVTKQTVAKDKAELEMTAKTPTGAVTTGTATLVKEGGGWKIDDEAWASPR